MNRPDDIAMTVRNQLCMDSVCKFRDGCGCVDAIAAAIEAAILSERERCAEVCDAFVQAYDEEIASLGLEQPRRGSPAKYAVKCIARDIRGASHD